MTRSSLFQRAVATIGALGLTGASFMAVSTVTSSVAQARESAPDQAPPPVWGTMLFLSVTKGSQTIGTAVLTCDPPAGMHPHPAAACADLNTAHANFTDLPGVPGALCDDMYDPVQATAFGWWRSPSLRFFSNTYGNICELYRSTGWVFPLPGTFPPPATTTTVPRPPPTAPVPTVTVTVPKPTIPGPPTVTIDPPDTAVPNAT